MTATRKTKLLVWVVALALIMACVPTLATPLVPTVNPSVQSIRLSRKLSLRQGHGPPRPCPP